MKRGALLLIVACLAPFAGACGSDHLETGYVYTPLGDSSAKRRGYYADPFSPEARAAQAEQQQAAEGSGRARQIPGQ